MGHKISNKKQSGKNPLIDRAKLPSVTVGENASSSLAFQASGPRSVFESIGMLG